MNTVGVSGEITRDAAFAAYRQSLFALGRTRLALVLALVLAGSLVEGLGVLLLVPLAGAVLGDSSKQALAVLPDWLAGTLAAWGGNGLLVGVLLLFVVSMLLRGAIIVERDHRLVALSSDLVEHWRFRLMRRLAAAPWRRVLTLRGSSLAHALTNEVGRLAVGSDRLLNGFAALVQLGVQTGVAMLLSPGMTGLAIIMSLAGLPLLWPLLRAASHYGETSLADGRKRHNSFADFLASMKLAKAHDAEAVYVAAFEDVSRSMRTATVRYIRAQSVRSALFQIYAALVGATVLYAGVTYFGLAAAPLFALLVLFTRIAGPVQMLMAGAQAIAGMLPAVAELLRIERDLSAPDAVGPVEAAAVPVRTSGPAAVTLSAVTLSLPGRDRPVLDAVSLDVTAGEMVALTGVSGAGKTTLADIIIGLVTPDTGSITVDGRVIDSAAARAAWRASVAYVPQDPFLFDETLRDNLCWANGAVDDAAIWRALEQADVAGLVAALPGQLDYRAGDRGNRLSGGERQRLCLARALLRQPRLLLLDEASSALDAPTEARLFATLRSLKSEMTVMAIAHRVTADAGFDRVLRLEDGRIG